MIIGTLSIKPELVKYAEVRRERKAWLLAIAYEIGDNAAELVAEYDDEEDATAAMVKLDEAVGKVKEPMVAGFGVASEADTSSGSDVESEGDMLASDGQEYRYPVMARIKRAIGFR